MSRAVSVFKHKRTTLERAEKFISTSEWTECNLTSFIYPETHPIKELSYYSPPFQPVNVYPKYNQLSFEEATINGKFTPTSVGQSFGPTWSTHWCRLYIVIPEKWVGEEVRLRWDSCCESQVWSSDGKPLEGLSSEAEKTDFVISRDLRLNETELTLYIELACNKLFGASTSGLIGPPDPNCYFTLKMAHISTFNRQVYNLIQDLRCIIGIAKHLPESNHRCFDALYAANQIVNVIQVDRDHNQAEQIAQEFLSQRNGDGQHIISAIGNCHIDCAWLWTYGETIRKCVRSWSSTIRLMEQYPEYTFACSQAQQLAWVKEYYPFLWEKIKKFESKGQFVVVGGTWVEMDGHMPSGEAFMRQFLYGQKFFRENFGKNCTEFWLPDTFGYSAQLPQIARHCGIHRFLTQKLSWSLVNSFPHHNFIWEGIDGSALITHFPPGDSYSMKMEVDELLKTVRNLKDKGRVKHSVLLFGHGDGGGGPTEDMIERALKLRNVDGVPKVEMTTPSKFFEHLEECSHNLSRWVGELYLELHNGTYTTQADIKRNNRRAEFAFRDMEILASVLFSITHNDSHYCRDEFINIWHNFLLNQFHDVLPGSCIRSVVEEALLIFNSLRDKQIKIQKSTLENLFGASDDELAEMVLVNTLSWPRTEIVRLANDTSVVVNVLSMGPSKLNSVDFVPVSVEQSGTSFVVSNCYLQATIDECGHVVSLKSADGNQEFIIPEKCANQFVLFEDVPLFWDAWDVMDYHQETRQVQNKIISPLRLVSSTPTEVELETKISVGHKSELTIIIILNCCKPYLLFDVTAVWKESHKFLKVEFPIDVLAREATYEIQFGHLTRPTHRNTSWDAARFEVCGHKWADISQHDLGVAILNNSKYGYSALGNKLSLSLLRSSKRPDEDADMGVHVFKYAIMPHTGTFQSAGVIERAYELNNPLILHTGGINSMPLVDLNTTNSWFSVDVPGVIIETVKRAEEIDLALVVRVYEAYGRRVMAAITCNLNVSKVVPCTGLEEPILNEQLELSNGKVSVKMSPFKIMSLIYYF